jgi:hypothetical protein
VEKRQVIFILIAFIIGGVAGYFVRDLPALLSRDEDLPSQLAQGEYVGDEVLEVTLQREDGTPLAGFEVDLWADGKQEGPPTAAISETNDQGVAAFKLKPGTYWLGYNLSNWPEELEIPVDQLEVVVEEGEVNTVTVTIKNR